MFEDVRVELVAFQDRSRVLAIASAGDVALALAAAGHVVTAVDVNPAQIAYVGERLRGGPRRRGQADRLMAAGRQLLRPAGWHRARLARLSAMTDGGEQVAEWRRLASGPSGAALRALLAPAVLRLGYRRPFAALAGPVARELPARIERGLALHPNRDNPFARLLFTGRPPEPVARPGGPVGLVVDDVAAHLERAPHSSYDAFALSNVLDGAPAAYRCRLLAALRHAASPGAIVVLRTLLPLAAAPGAPIVLPTPPADTVREPGATAVTPTAAVAAAEGDRALIWGGITIASVEEMP